MGKDDDKGISKDQFDKDLKNLMNVPPPKKPKRNKGMNKTQLEDVIEWSEILDSRYFGQIANAKREGKIPEDFKISKLIEATDDDISLKFSYLSILPESLFQDLYDGIEVIRKRHN